MSAYLTLVACALFLFAISFAAGFLITFIWKTSEPTLYDTVTSINAAKARRTS